MFHITAILILALLIFVHELGHFLLARLFGVGVYEFAIGFGPTVFQTKVGETVYAIRAIPLGGFVRMVGESLEESEELTNPKERAMSFSEKSYLPKFAIVVAGPLFNVLFAFFVGTAAYFAFGLTEPSLEPKIGGVVEKSPADKAGLKAGDVVTAVNETPVLAWSEIVKIVSESKGAPVAISVVRDAAPHTFTVAGESEKIEEAVPRGDSAVSSRYRIGIMATLNRTPISISEAASNSARDIWNITILTGRLLLGMFSGQISTKHIGGPIAIVSEAARSAEKGIEYTFNFMVLMSMSLALLNLLPVPILDGGHLVIFAIEAIIRRPIGIKAQMIANQIGFVLLVSLMLFAVGNDIRGLIGGS